MGKSDFEESLEQRIRDYTWAAAFFKEMVDELGKEKAKEITFKALSKLRKEEGHCLAQELGGSFEAFRQSRHETAKKLNTVDIVEESEDAIVVKIKRCTAWEAANHLGVPDMCRMFCETDAVFAEAYNPKMKHEAKSRCSAGDDVCINVWRWEDY